MYMLTTGIAESVCAGDAIITRDDGLSICAGGVVMSNLGGRDVDCWISRNKLIEIKVLTLMLTCQW